MKLKMASYKKDKNESKQSVNFFFNLICFISQKIMVLGKNSSLDLCWALGHCVWGLVGFVQVMDLKGINQVLVMGMKRISQIQRNSLR